MAAVFEFYSSNSKIDYPFDARQVDDLNLLFVDAYIIHNLYTTKQQRVYLANFDPAGICELRFEDGTLLSVLTGADNFITSVFGAYTIYAWQRNSVSGPGFTNEDIAVKLVVLTSKLADFSFPHASSTAYLLQSLVNPRVKRVRRIGVALPGVACCTGGGITEKPVILEAGFNASIQLLPAAPGGGVLGVLSADPVRTPKVISIDAVPGAGTGLFPTCTSLTPAIKKINSAAADANGNVGLEGRDCVWTERRITAALPPIHPFTNYLAIVQKALLQLHADCKACCDCDDYKDAYEAISRQWHKALILSRRVEILRKKYHEIRDTILASKAANEVGLSVHLRTVSRPDFHLALSAIVTNNSDTPLGLTEIKFTLDIAGFVYTPSSGLLDVDGLRNTQFDPLLVGNTLSLTIGGLGKVKYAVYTCEIRYGPTVIPNRAGLLVRPKVTVTSGAQTAEDEKAVTLTGPLLKT